MADIPNNALVCAARHYIVAHESAKNSEIVNLGEVCRDCPCLSECRCDWTDTVWPLFEAAGIYPKLFSDTPPAPSCIAGSPLLCRLRRRIHGHRRRGSSKT